MAAGLEMPCCRSVSRIRGMQLASDDPVTGDVCQRREVKVDFVAMAKSVVS